MCKRLVPSCVTYMDGYKVSASLLASKLELPLLSYKNANSNQQGSVLLVSDCGLAIHQLEKSTPGPISCDFIGSSVNHRRLYGGGINQDLVKAIGIRSMNQQLFVLDLMAGLGRDGFILASLGSTVLMLERNKIVAALLADGLDRARNIKSNHGIDFKKILNRISLLTVDAKDYLNKLGDTSKPDVIYLDPMFPSREKSSKVKKEMQLLHQLVGLDGDAGQILSIARKKAKYRVVVKRPARGKFLGDQEPGYSLKGKSTRYDIYPIKKIPTEFIR